MSRNIDAKVDFGKITGTIKTRLHGSNSCPPLSTRGLMDFEREFKAMNFHTSRTHDWPLWNAGQRMIDTHFVFPLFKLDPADPTNYYFKATDAVIRNCQNAGTKVLYRLGTSIEHSGDEHFNMLVPENYEKYAEILAGIVRHYTQGWADGFHYDIEYWEIWNEPDLGKSTWGGTFDEFIPLFITVLKRLKNEFPNLKIGGPAMAWYRPDHFTKLLSACKAENIAPDFISWHSYTSDADGLIKQPETARKLLDSLGFTKTETCIDEWHYLISWDGVQSSATPEMRRRAMSGPAGLNGIDAAAFNLAVLSGWQETTLGTACCYGAGVASTWGWVDEDRALTKNYYSMVLFGGITADYTQKAMSGKFSPNVYTLAAKSEDGKRACLLVSDYRGTGRTLDIGVEGMAEAKHVSAVVLDNDRDIAPAEIIWHNNRLTLVKNDNLSAAFLVTFEL